MVTYYVKIGEVYKVSATEQCDVYDANGNLYLSCDAGLFITFNAPTSKLSLSSDSSTITCISEVSSDLSGLTEHVNNSSIHTTPNDKSRWNNIVNDLSDIEDEIPELEATVRNLNTSVNNHVESESIHMTSGEREKLNAAHTHTSATDVHITSTERETWNGKANGTHTHSISDVANLQSTLNSKANGTHAHNISDITNLQTTLNGKANGTHTHAISDITDLQTTLNEKASTSDLNSLDVGVKRIDYWTGKGGGVEVYDNNGSVLTDASSFFDTTEYTATKDVCLIYTVTNSPGSGYTSDFNGFYHNYPLKMYMTVNVNGSYLLCEAASRRICSGGIDFIQVHLKAGDQVKFHTGAIGTYTGYVRIRLLEYNYR